MSTNDLMEATRFHPGKPWRAGFCTCRRDHDGGRWFACRRAACEAPAQACGGYCGPCFVRIMNLPPRPEVVVLCGSTRFSEAWAKARYDLTLAGKIVLTIGCDTKSDEGLGITPEQKEALDELHKRKIDLADRSPSPQRRWLHRHFDPLRDRVRRMVREAHRLPGASGRESQRSEGSLW
jgi:hypothetical protein